MKKVIKETIEWYSPENKHPPTNKRVLLQTNDGILFGYWNKEKQKWGSLDNGSVWGHMLNSDTYVYRWSFPPSGVKEMKIL